MTEDELRVYYESDSYSEAYRGSVCPNDGATRLRDEVAAHRADALSSAGLLKCGQTLLEIGCGAGNFLEMASRRGVRAFGVEPSTGYANSGKNVGRDIDHGSFPERHGPLNCYDVIAAFHVLEHMANPRETLHNILSLLKPDGVIVLEVPDISRALGLRWTERYFHRPHLVDFSLPTLSYLLETEGLSLVYNEYAREIGRSHHLLVATIAGGIDLRPMDELPDAVFVRRLIRRVRRRVALTRPVLPVLQWKRRLRLSGD